MTKTFTPFNSLTILIHFIFKLKILIFSFFFIFYQLYNFFLSFCKVVYYFVVITFYLFSVIMATKLELE